MTEVVSYRVTDKNNKTLSRLSKKRGMPMATLTAKIIDDYLNYNLPLEESGYAYLPKSPLKIMLKLLDESKLYPIIEASVSQIRIYLSLYHGEITDDVVLDALRAWCDGNRLSLEVIDENDHIKIMFNHGLGITWSKIVRDILSQLFVSEMINVIVDEDLVSFELSKKTITDPNNVAWLD